MAHEGHTYRDVVAAYIEKNFGARSLTVYTECQGSADVIALSSADLIRRSGHIRS
jgi:hypothetical protein